jgi:cardiolipin synthase A/B
VLALVAAAVVLVAAHRAVLHVARRPSWPPPPSAVTPSGAAAAVSSESGPLEFAWSTAATLEPWVEGREFFPRIFADVEAARSSVHILMFGWREGEVGMRMTALLERKLAEGVEVRVLVDGMGSKPFKAARAMYTSLAAAGARIVVEDLFRDQIGRVDHRKLYVIDGAVAWTGGAGIEDHFEDGRFHDLFVRVTGPVVAQLQLVFVASFRWLGGEVRVAELDELFPALDDGDGALRARVLHNAPGRFRPITDEIARLFDGAVETLDVVNPYVTDRGMILRIERAAARGVRVRLFVPAEANNWACASAQHFHHDRLLDAGVRILDYPTMLHAKAFVRDGEEVIAGTCNLEAWSLKRFFEIDLQLWSAGVAEQFEERFAVPAEAVSAPGKRLVGRKERARAAGFALISPFL